MSTSRESFTCEYQEVMNICKKRLKLDLAVRMKESWHTIDALSQNDFFSRIKQRIERSDGFPLLMSHDNPSILPESDMTDGSLSNCFDEVCSENVFVNTFHNHTATVPATRPMFTTKRAVLQLFVHLKRGTLPRPDEL